MTASSSSEASSTTPVSSATRPLVLVVEDNLINQKIVVRMVTKLGFETVIAENGELGAQIAKQRRKDLAAVLMDCQMPVMDGFAATEAIRADERDQGHTRVPIIAVTANALESDRERCMKVGMDGFVTKPIQRGILRDALTRSGVEIPDTEAA